MDHIYFYENLSREELSAKTKTLHVSPPATYSGDMCLPSSFNRVVWNTYLKQLCNKIRKKWQGIDNLSICFGMNTGINKINIVVGLSAGVYSLSLFVLDYFVDNIMKLKTQAPEDIDLSCSEDEEESDEVPPNMVQIHATPQEVEQWIQSFINGKRNLINIQNIKDFCVPEGLKQNCARVDAVLVKRKNARSHIGVEHVSNYWGPQLYKKMAHGSRLPLLASHPPSIMAPVITDTLEQVDAQQTQHSDIDAIPPPTKKLALTVADINKRLESLKSKMNQSKSDSDSS